MKNKKNEIVKPEPQDAVLGFFSTEGANSGIQASAFDAREEMEITLRHARDPDPKISLAGLRHFRTILKDVANANGLVGSIQEVRENKSEDGTTVKQVVSTNALLSRLQERRHATTIENHLEHHPAEAKAQKAIGHSSDDRDLPDEHAENGSAEEGSSGT